MYVKQYNIFLKVMESAGGEGRNSEKHDSQYLTLLKILMSVTVFSQAAYRYLPGPTLIDVGARIKESILNMPLVYSARAVGYIIGMVFGTVAMQRVLYSRQKTCLLFFLMTFLLCISTFAICMVKTFNGLLISFFCSGVWMAFVDCGFKAVCLHPDIQRSKFFLTLYLFYGLGAFFAPLISKSYIRKRVNISWMTEKPHIHNGTTSDLWKFSYMTSVSYAYVVISFLYLISSLLWLVLYSLVSSDPPQEPQEEHGAESAGRVIQLACILNAALMSFFSEAVAFSYVQILPVFYLIATKTSVHHGVDLTLLFLGFFALAPVVAMLVSIKIDVHSMLVLGVSMSFIGCIIDFMYIKSGVVNFWIANAFLGFGFGPLFPCSYSWLCQKLDINHFNIIAIFLTSALSEMIIPWFLSRLVWLNTPNRDHFILTVTLTYFVLLVVQYFLLYGVKDRKGEPQPPPAVLGVMPPSIIRRFAVLDAEVKPRTSLHEETLPNIASMQKINSSEMFERISQLRGRVERSNEDVIVTLKKLRDV